MGHFDPYTLVPVKLISVIFIIIDGGVISNLLLGQALKVGSLFLSNSLPLLRYAFTTRIFVNVHNYGQIIY